MHDPGEKHKQLYRKITFKQRGVTKYNEKEVHKQITFDDEIGRWRKRTRRIKRHRE